MKRKLVLILCLAFFLSLSLTLSAQDYYKKQKSAPVQESRKKPYLRKNTKTWKKASRRYLKN